VSDYLVGSHDDRMAVFIQVDEHPVVALFAGRDSYDVYRWAGFCRRIFRRFAAN
jgi:hypothetical protein